MARAPSHRSKTVIGWSERLALPDWGIECLKAKVDTGARTSALHVEDLQVLPDGMLQFDVILSRKNPGHRVRVVAPPLRRARVRSSNGAYRRRWFVKTRLCLGAVEKEIEISLVSREKMVFRMLLGRKALEKDFLVDVGRKNLVRAPEVPPQ